jgi:hypothetical protein
MARRMHHFDLQLPQPESVPILEQAIELTALPRYVLEIEYRAKDRLHVADVLADAGFGPLY